MVPEIKAAYGTETKAARASLENGDIQQSYYHLERAHILGQSSSALHIHAHWLLLRTAIVERNYKEIAGQLIRLISAGPATLLKLYPKGNNGRAGTGIFTEMKIPADMQDLLDTTE